MDRGAQRVPLTTQLTEWDDILIRKKIVTRDQCLLAKGFSPQEVAAINAADVEDDDDDEDDAGALAAYRAQRIAEFKAAAAKLRFGTVVEVRRRDEWLSEVNDASTEAVVVVHLYQDRIDACRTLDAALEVLADRRQDVKFVRMVATEAADDWPDARLPALLVYRRGQLADQIIGSDFDFDRASLSTVMMN